MDMRSTYGPQFRSKSVSLTAFKTARMARGVLKGKHTVFWGSRTGLPPQRRQSLAMDRNETPSRAPVFPEGATTRPLAAVSPDGRQTLYESPLPSPLLSRRPPSYPTTGMPSNEGGEHSESIPRIPIEATSESPHVHMTERAAGKRPSTSVGSREDNNDNESLQRWETVTLTESSLERVREGGERAWAEGDTSWQELGGSGDEGRRGREPEEQVEEDNSAWGEPFEITWIRTTHLPFTRTKHLKNPWNSNRQVKVSRDGTELEPLVGKALLDEWERFAPPQGMPMMRREPRPHS